MLKFKNVLVLFLLAITFITCAKKEQADLKKKVDSTTSKIGKELDTIGKEIDTLVSSISKSDTIFDEVKIVQVDTSKLLPRDIRKKMNNIFSHYINIKEALTKNDTAGAQKHAKEMLDVIVETQNEVSGEIVDKKWEFTPDKIKKISGQIESVNSLEKQRMMFKELSNSMIEFIKKYGLSNKTIYQLKCNKALSGLGGSWLADTKNSDNPYLGDKDNNVKEVACAEVTGAWEFH